MKTLTDKDFEKVELLVGFYNQIVRVVSNPEEEQDYNTGDSSVFAIGYEVDYCNKEGVGKVRIDNIQLEHVTVAYFRRMLKEIGERVKTNSRIDYTKQWEEL